MRIQHNISALNTHRNLASNNAQTSKALEKLSSGYKINKAGDDAAGLAISEKMRGQIRGLDMAAKNSQDGISLIQTTEGALAESHSILQRMRELATQASNDTNVSVDRGEIQKEINQLTSELNRIGNTTEFNTQKLLQGDAKTQVAGTNLNLEALTTETKGTDEVVKNVKVGINLTEDLADGETLEVSINGRDFTLTYDDEGDDAGTTTALTNNSATIDLGSSVNDDDDEAVSKATAAALQKMIDADSALKGNFKVSANGTGEITIEAVKDGAYSGTKAEITVNTTTEVNVDVNNNTSGTPVGVTTDGATGIKGTETAATAAKKEINFDSITAATDAEKLVGKGLTVGDKELEFYDASKGAYEGQATGIDISAVTNASLLVQAIVDQAGTSEKVSLSANGDNLVVASKELGAKGEVNVENGVTNKNFEVTFQVGANTGQAMTIEIADMRSSALGVVGKSGDEGFTTELNVNNGTDNKNVEAALDVSTHEKATAAIKVINDALEKVSAQRSNLGAFQNRLEHTINNLGAASENLTAAESRIRDTDMAAEMMTFTKNNILTQAAQSMLAQANQQPQGVLQLLG